jgi:3-isopropylmalate/(R)-2-methylmalate dehydratase small subunit
MSADAFARCPIWTGHAWAFGIDVPASMIVPPTAAREPHPGRLLMTPVDPDFPSRLEPGDILVAAHFGGGTTDDAPVRALRDARVGAVLAATLDPTFARLALEAGFPAVEVHEALAIHTGEVLRVDLEGGRVANQSSGDRYPIRNLDESKLVVYRSRFDGAEA